MQELEAIGLGKNEIKVYIALLKRGETTTTSLQKDTQVQISALYYALDNLIAKGLITYTLKANKKHFQAKDPEYLLQIIKQKEQNVKKILPELKVLQKEQEEQVQTNVHEGYKSYKGIYDNILKELKKGDEYYVIGARQIADKKNKTLYLMFKNFHKQRDKLGIKAEIIFNRDVKKQIEKTKYKHLQYRFADVKTNSFILIYKNKVIDFQFTDRLIAIETISKEISDSYKKYFKEMWKQAS